MTREESTVFIVTFRPSIEGIDPVRALRAVLKFGMRRFGLKCVSVREIQTAPDDLARAPAALPEPAPKGLHSK